MRESDDATALGALAAAGPRAAEAPETYELLFEAIREGYLLHYGEPRLLDGAEPDLKLLAGDYLYALGLERLAARGDLEAIRELGDLISLSAQLHARSERGDHRAAVDRGSRGGRGGRRGASTRAPRPPPARATPRRPRSSPPPPGPRRPQRASGRRLPTQPTR